MSFLVAVATSDDESVNLHFGHAEALSVYEVSPDGSYSFLKKRKVPSISFVHGCNESSNCSDGCGEQKDHGGCGVHAAGRAIEEIAMQLQDVSYVLASRIGPKMSKALGVRGITALAVELPLCQAFQKLAVFDARINRFRH